MGECAWDEPGKMGRMLTGCERRGDSTRKKSCEGSRRDSKKEIMALPLPGAATAAPISHPLLKEKEKEEKMGEEEER